MIEDTNRLLQRLIEINEEQRVRSEELKKDNEVRMKALKDKSDAAMKEHLIKRGLSPEDAGSEEDWKTRAEEARKMSKERLEASQQQTLQFRTEMLQELKTQSDLLRQILEKLER
jgi:hypothetical protein